MLSFCHQTLHSLLKHGAVRCKPDACDIAMLGRSQKIACPADFQIAHGDFKAAPEFSKFSYGVQTLFCNFAKHFILIIEEPGTCNFIGTPYPSAHLINLGKSKLVCIIDQHRIGIWLIQPVFDQGCAKQDIMLSLIEIKHHFFKDCTIHPAIGNSNRYRIRQYALQMIQHGRHRLNPVVDKE